MINFNNVEFEKSVGNLKQLTKSDLPEIVFSGKSNVGKSSLINKLLGRKSLARVSSKPGKTITINYYKVENLRLVDLPGYGYAKTSFAEKKRWSELVNSYFSSNRNIILVVQIIDMRHKPSILDFQMLDFLYENKLPFVIVASKSDKLNKTETLNRKQIMEIELEKYSGVPRIEFSSMTGKGLSELKSLIDISISSEK